MEPHRALAIALLGSQEKADLYNNSASFRMAVDQLAKSLPIWVDGLATEARKIDRAHKEAIEEMSRIGSLVKYPPIAPPPS